MRISDWSSDVCSSDLLPDLEVPWPEIEDAAAIPGEADSAVPPDQAERRYSIRVDGLDQVAGDGIRRQFDELSSLKREAEGDADANAAQIDRRAREDVELLQDLLRAAGYYEARVERLITAAPERPEERRVGEGGCRRGK